VASATLTVEEASWHFPNRSSAAAMSPKVSKADGDPVNIYVISERAIDRSEIMLDYEDPYGG
jgi:hypothetical protein